MNTYRVLNKYVWAVDWKGIYSLDDGVSLQDTFVSVLCDIDATCVVLVGYG